jgi:hypothetical protein
VLATQSAGLLDHVTLDMEDSSTTTTTIGDTVPYVVRLERGTINRAVYEVAILHEPDTPVPDPWTQTPGWNGRLVYTFGGACGIGHTQATSTGGVLNDLMLSQGYAVASATFNVFANNCNDVTSAETASMVKEHVVETYGVPEATMGWGASAGTMQQHMISGAYPGLLNGLMTSLLYEDHWFQVLDSFDCLLLSRYFGLGGAPNGRMVVVVSFFPRGIAAHGLADTTGRLACPLVRS